ncbi:hypothetical protein ALP58_101265 [Pseudomonas savastanoi]|uniref:Uncharacterized protein n=4 Tax=Pseudomonas syringae group genomosp. 2 TaxID=251698 RepID=A0A3M5G1P3_PSESS|nr:hypothetical protein ALO90_101375 [Pseudomonas amygdali pv. aesculi]KPW70494.1 hypothetical protein ALO78_101125 [Pseudomonas amygdali pv. ciccaronei]KPX07915.1 hypothetical protein ALO74_101312 [Pseudomonas syringae pv. cunninghamiae]KPX81118.1 hypothetical protein ALO53_101389 [Pseudomonas amygdali pv. photiniae]KPY04036.1 hypothetical protein ALO61_101227 [Pseudomonas savastanoi pv. nerii]KPY38276.1 hypothetical protein ALO48_101171 [Pseudomonas syringae pv. rhaphiolepidis]KPY40923.1 hy
MTQALSAFSMRHLQIRLNAKAATDSYQSHGSNSIRLMIASCLSNAASV